MILGSDPGASETKDTRMAERGEGANLRYPWLVPPWANDSRLRSPLGHKRFGGKKTHGNNWLNVMVPWMVPPWGTTGARSSEGERLIEKEPWMVPPWHYPSMRAQECELRGWEFQMKYKKKEYAVQVASTRKIRWRWERVGSGGRSF